MELSKKQTYLATFFLGLIFFGTWTGQTFLDVGFLGLCGIWIHNSWLAYKANPQLKWKALGLRTTGVEGLFLAYFIIACLGYAINGREGANAIKYLSRFSTLLQIYVLMWIFERLAIDGKKALRVLAIATLFPAVYGIVLWFSMISYDQDYRTIGIIKSSIVHAIVGGFFVVFMGSLLVKEFKKMSSMEKVLQVLSFLIVLISTSMTKTRGVWIVLVFMAGLVFLSFFKNRTKIILVVLGVVLAGAFWISPYKSLVLKSHSDFCRQELYKVHFRMIQDKPILGIGYLDNYRFIEDYWPLEGKEDICAHERGGAAHAHNQYVNVAATTGIPSLFIFLAFFLYFIVLTIRILRNQTKDTTKFVLASTALYLQIYFMLAGMTEIPFEYAKIRILILAVWAWVVVNQVPGSKSGTQRAK